MDEADRKYYPHHCVHGSFLDVCEKCEVTALRAKLKELLSPVRGDGVPMEAVSNAWYQIGADLKGLKWEDFHNQIQDALDDATRDSP